MSDLIDTIKYRGFYINIYQDDYPESPREWDNLGTIVNFNTRHAVGDINDEEHDEFLRGLAAEALDIEVEDISDKSIPDILEKHYEISPVYMYDHSNITISTAPFSCPWDSGQIGYIYVSHETLRKTHGWHNITTDRQKMVNTWLKQEIETYDQYLRGETYRYQIEPAENNKAIRCDDIGCGYIGHDWYLNGLFDDAKGAINYEIREYRKQVIKDYAEKMQTKRFYATCWAD